MKLSTRARYGTRLMLELGLSYGKGPVFLKDISASQEISEKYLSQIIIPLRAAGLVDSYRGAKGGYSLSRPPYAITLKEIVENLEGGLELVSCIRNPDECNKIAECVTRDIWKSVSKTITDVLSGITVDTLVKMYKLKQEKSIMYSI
ncbi:MAG: Rrf2 family transcriptional regulator [Candidatus Omnitrophica bacterium]|nr:Rrf2 family transcriptional regulator [Candidatus Omnitrophota bacterium]